MPSAVQKIAWDSLLPAKCGRFHVSAAANQGGARWDSAARSGESGEDVFLGDRSGTLIQQGAPPALLPAVEWRGSLQYD